MEMQVAWSLATLIGVFMATRYGAGSGGRVKLEETLA